MTRLYEVVFLCIAMNFMYCMITFVICVTQGETPNVKTECCTLEHKLNTVRPKYLTEGEANDYNG